MWLFRWFFIMLSRLTKATVEKIVVAFSAVLILIEYHKYDIPLQMLSLELLIFWLIIWWHCWSMTNGHDGHIVIILILNDADGATAQAWYLLIQNLWSWQLNFKCSGSAGLHISSYTPCSTPQYVGEPTSSDFSGAGGRSPWWVRWWRRRCSARRRRCTPSSLWPEVKTVRLRNLPPRDLSASPKSRFVTHTDHICDTHWSYLWHSLIIFVTHTDHLLVWSSVFWWQFDQSNFNWWWRVFTLDITPQISSCNEIGDIWWHSSPQ